MMKKTGPVLMALSLLAGTTLPTAAEAFSFSDANHTDVVYNGLAAGLHFTVPFGGTAEKTPEPRLSLGFDVYKAFTPTSDPFVFETRRASLASFDFTGHGFDRLAIANQTAFSTQIDPETGQRLGFVPTPSTILWTAVVAGAAVGVYLLVN